MAQNLRCDNYRRFINIPAYYDPNKKAVYLNRQTVEKQTQKTLFIICYHELVHAASIHRNYRDNGLNIFQSGIKLERFGKQHYSCSNRMLNEGMTQFLTNYYNTTADSDYAYAHESALVRRVASILGVESIKQAMVAEGYEQFEQLFNQTFGRDSFSLFSHWLDKRRYQKAAAILDEANPVFVPTFQSHVTI